MRLRFPLGRRPRDPVPATVDPPAEGAATTESDEACPAGDIQALAAGLQAPGLVLPTYWC
ncbi:hypothetical protein FOH10_23395 [Nocardia otitidiscaviarum]|uniref:Uncharacterized protein n=1 Tax=Nocardia otitidiscaviarum TaxID=1823 RepID=A0A516NQP5_9NOCA|nr:hypothetical protein [Nocardia otitidiscaviarum]MCP9620408.1 hypothetical protein [Nocardia otitidiscaviarum]QDP81218.1 hypothetical protein FOH10_23395 [Nocardia otitidiscaviarum]